MRLLLLPLLLCLPTLSVQAEPIPTPKHQVTFNLQSDPRKWVPRSSERAPSGFLMEFTPDNETIQDWHEVFASQVSFTSLSALDFADAFRARLLRADPKIQLKISGSRDGSLTIEYVSLLAKEASIRRIVRGQDGIYMFAYHVRPALRTEAVWERWRRIIAAAALRPPP
jgi:hypothetical protein